MKTEFIGIYISKECGIVDCVIRSKHRVNLPSDISSWVSPASAQQKLSTSASICRQLLHLHHLVFAIRLLLHDCSWRFPSGSLSSSFEEARGSKEYSILYIATLISRIFHISTQISDHNFTKIVTLVQKENSDFGPERK